MIIQIILKTIEKALGFFESTVSMRDKTFKNAKLIAAPKDKYNQVINSILTNQFDI